eukprot:NODE_2592_length_897_cov_208.117925_g2130_i0.p1 GENE.NODE_2592_length_897_cov_208.117925_g2130_i0~~NODE_2592_length_897_cov_208.117925_g2130_i0.p1  ORF type:complete len:199 (-),score=42.80 NODE_2592_length_897_cov_208.117925_g2130_i0:257-853(-)
MEKYRRVPKEKVEESIQPNEIRVVAMSQRSARNYISYGINLLTAEEEDKKHSQIVVRAMGRAINKTINICEIVKRRVPGLHQITKLESNILVDHFEPLMQGLDPKEITRTVSSISITLSKDKLDESDPGYGGGGYGGGGYARGYGDDGGYGGYGYGGSGGGFRGGGGDYGGYQGGFASSDQGGRAFGGRGRGRGRGGR